MLDISHTRAFLNIAIVSFLLSKFDSQKRKMSLYKLKIIQQIDVTHLARLPYIDYECNIFKIEQSSSKKVSLYWLRIYIVEKVRNVFVVSETFSICGK